LKPAVYRVQEPLANGALPGDYIVYWGEEQWTLQRQVERPENMDYLKLLHYHSPRPEPRAEEQPPRLGLPPRPKAETPRKAPQTPN